MRLSLALIVAALLPGGAGAQSLRYEGDEGQNDRYRLTNTARIHQTFQGAAVDLTVRSRGLLNVQLVEAEHDTLTYSLRFDSLDLKLEGPPVPAPDVSAIVGKTMTLKLSPTGHVHAFQMPTDLPATPSGCEPQEMQMVSHFFPRLPAQGVKPGASWSDTLSSKVCFQQGLESDVKVVTTYTMKGEAKGAEGTFVEVDYGTSTTIQGEGEQGGAPLVLQGKGNGSGTIRFASEGSAFWSSRGTQTLQLIVDVTPAGQPPMSIPIDQEITTEIQHD